MHITSEQFDQSLIPEVFGESQLIALKRSLLKRRRKMVISNVALLILIFSTTIASACLIGETNRNNSVVDGLDQHIRNVSDHLIDKIVNQTIRFNSTDGLKNIVIVSDTQEGSRRIARIDIKDSGLQSFKYNRLPTLQTLQLPQSIEVMINNTLGIESLNTSLFSLYQITQNNLSQILQLEFNKSAIRMLNRNILTSLQNLSFTDSEIAVFADNSLPDLEYLQLNNNSNLQVISLKSPKLKELEIDGMSIQTISIQQSNLTSLRNYCNATAISILNSPLKEIQCQSFKNAVMLAFQNISVTTLRLNCSSLLRELVIVNLSLLTSVSIELANPSESGLSVSIVSTSLPSFSNQYSSITQLVMTGNDNLTLFQNNTLTRLTSIISSASFVSIQNNSLPELIKWMIVLGKKELGNNIIYFNNNKLPKLVQLSLNDNKLRSFRNNVLTSLTLLNMSSNSLNDTVAGQTLLFNSWSNSIVKTVDLSNNKLINKAGIRGMYQQAFPNAIIIL